MNPKLIAAREKLVATLEKCKNPLLGRSFIPLAVMDADDAERIEWDEHDTRMLSGTLTMGLRRAAERGDHTGFDLYGAKLVAVLSDLADLGDEQAADGINRCAITLPPYLVQLGRACAAMRREQRNG